MLNSTPFNDRLLRIGWIFLAASFAIFCFTMNVPADDIGGGLFLVNYAAAIGYLFLPLLLRQARLDEHRVHYRMIQLLLFYISAFALNRTMDIFGPSTGWLTALMIVTSVNILATVFIQSLPKFVQFLMLFIHGVALALFAYQAIYLLSLYAPSFIGLLAIGLSFHTYVPLLLFIFTCRLLNRVVRWKTGWAAVAAGGLFAVAVCVSFVMVWNVRVKTLNNAYAESMMSSHDELPLWVQAAQQADNDGITQKVLTGDLIYSAGQWDDLWRVPSRNFGGGYRRHDPLVVLAMAMSPKLQLTEDDRIKVLESGYKARHEALRRLWSGDDLVTSAVSTHIKVWPNLHLAYTEKFITVSDTRKEKRWGLQEEAIYTFHLPEGALVTALSLWINGHEEKAVLTSKGKADSAYTEIVGYERRDPSVVHWQEGNTVTVRVFPIDPATPRLFKIGITSPLRQEGRQLAYDNTWFEGPSAGGAQETVKVVMANAPRSFVHTTAYRSVDGSSFTASRDYEAVWSLHFTDPGIEPNRFVFDGWQYRISPYARQRVPADITDVYLDLNASWKAADVQAVLDAAKGRRIWVYGDTLEPLTDENRELLIERGSAQQFSLFPFQLIRDRSHALVVSKSTSYTPNLYDLDGSAFLRELRASAVGECIRLFHIGPDLSPYLRSLNEFRRLDLETGQPDLLRQLLQSKTFVHDQESDNEVNIHTAGVTITKTPVDGASSAPDHLMRLFAYNHILFRSASLLQGRDTEDSTLVDEAQQAYVVSPVSSLIVLESQQDYDRYGIKDKNESLKNANMKGKGAVPEPGEWAIIILSVVVFAFFFIKWRTI